MVEIFIKPKGGDFPLLEDDECLLAAVSSLYCPDFSPSAEVKFRSELLCAVLLFIFLDKAQSLSALREGGEFDKGLDSFVKCSFFYTEVLIVGVKPVGKALSLLDSFYFHLEPGDNRMAGEFIMELLAGVLNLFPSFGLRIKDFFCSFIDIRDEIGVEDFSFLVLEIDDTPLVREVLGKGFYPVGIGFCVGFFELFLDDLVISVFIDKDFEELEGSSDISRGSVLVGNPYSDGFC